MRARAKTESPRWNWARIEEILRDLQWDRPDLEACARDYYGREFMELSFKEGIVILRSMTHLISFKRWKEKHG